MPSPTSQPGRSIARFGLLLLLAGFFQAFGAEHEVAAPGASGRPATAGAAHPFVVFPITKWYPTRPVTDTSTDTIVCGVIVAVPFLSAIALWRLYRQIKSSGGRSGWMRILAANLLLLIFLLSTALLVGETYFRFFVDTTDSLGFTRISERWVRRHWHPNGAGCRDDIEYSPLISPGKRRLTFVGDSFTAGHGIKNVEDRFPNRLRAAHPDWEIHVLANVGLDTGAEISVLKKAFFRGYQLDEVVLVYCLNDVGDLLLGSGGPFAGRMPAVDEVGPWFTRGSYFLDLYYNRYRAARNPFVKDYFAFVKSGYRGEYWEAQKRRLDDFQELVQSRGGRLTVVTFPFLNSLGPGYDYGFVHEELSQFWKQQHVTELDLLPVYSGRSSKDLTVNAHDAHPNELASRLAAEAIERVLWPVFTNRVQQSIGVSPAPK